MNSAARVGYIVSRFPKITETFVLYEMIELERTGMVVELFPLRRERQPVIHPEATAWIKRAHYLTSFSGAVLAANLRQLLRRPGRCISTFLRAVWGNREDLNLLVGVVVYWPKAVAIADMVERAGIEHLHAHFANHPTMVAHIVHRLTGVPYSFTAHGSDIHVRQAFLGPKINDAAFVVAISEFNKRFMVDHAPLGSEDSHIEVIHCGVDVDVFAAAPTRRTAPLLVLCVASFEIVKGHPHLLRALARLRERGVELQCELVGAGPEEHAVRALVTELGLSERVVFCGTLTREDVAERMRAADVVVLTSVPSPRGDMEGIPVVLMEAMASGRPVVSTRQSGIPELVVDGETGLLTEAGDDVAIADALELLAKDPDRRERMGQAARVRIERHFDVRRESRELAERLRSSADQHRMGGG
jgi:colanic acid/amylovoran biosynthesis glycosyltransferase